MTLNNGNQFSTRMLIMYLVSALLFLTSVKLHIHAHGDSVAANQASPVIHISSVTGNLDTRDQKAEINISPLGVLKASPNVIIMIAVFLVAILVAILSLFECVIRIRDFQTRLPGPPVFGTPLLRAPPVFNS
jgi:hypothetical protein